MKSSRLFQNSLMVVAVVGSLVLLNVLGLRAFKRFDLTKDRMYTLSAASRDAVADLKDPITLTAYFSADLPPPYAANARYVRDLLQEYRAASRGKVAFEFIDPTAQETEADKEKKKDVKRDLFGRTYREATQVERELSDSGIQPVELQVVAEDQMQTKRAYMGLVVRHRDQKESIPLIQDTSTLEYDVTSLIRKLTRARAPAVGVVVPEGDFGSVRFNALQELLKRQYDVRDVKLTEAVPADLDALFVLGPQAPVDAPAQGHIEAFLAQGKSAAFFVDAARVDPRTFEPTAVQHGLAPLFAKWGIKTTEGLVADGRAATLRMEEQRGTFRAVVPVLYPFVPEVLQLEGNSPITKGLTRMHFPFASPLTVESKDGFAAIVLANSSEKSLVENPPYNLSPRREWRESPAFTGPHALLVQVMSKAEKGGRIIVSGTSALAWDEFLSPANQALMLNVADFLLLDSAMLSMRTRGLSVAPLKPDLSDAIRTVVKYGNAVGIPLLLALFGVVHWRMRERRRARAAVFA
ncbi:MAG: GldG family protein [Myxococcaceae bacterium]